MRRGDREREFLCRLGERLRLVRRGRRLSRARVGALVSADIERGSVAPSALTLHRLSEVLQVPLPVLVDEQLAPIDLLQELAQRERAGE